MVPGSRGCSPHQVLPPPDSAARFCRKISLANFGGRFGLAAVEIAVELKQKNPDSLRFFFIGGTCFLVALVFAWRSFYGMRIPVAPTGRASRK
jgi:hypothetical protein